MDRQPFIDWLFSDPGKAAVAGALGGIVRWITLRHNWREGSVTLVVGAICAIYLGPLIVPIIEPIVGAISPNSDADGLSAFLVGIAGISLSGMMIDIFDRRRRDVNKEDKDV